MHAHRLEIARTGDAKFSIAFSLGIVINQKLAIVATTEYRQSVDSADCHNARQGSQLFQCLFIKSRSTSRRVIVKWHLHRLGLQRNLHHYRALGVKTRIDSQHFDETLDKQSRAD